MGVSLGTFCAAVAGVDEVRANAATCEDFAAAAPLPPVPLPPECAEVLGDPKPCTTATTAAMTTHAATTSIHGRGRHRAGPWDSRTFIADRSLVIAALDAHH